MKAKEKVNHIFCKGTKQRHEPGEWELEADCLLYKEYVKKCFKCGEVVNRRIVT